MEPQNANNKSKTDNTSLLIVEIGCVDSKEKLLQVLAENLRFPDYFGYNWDALVECLTDFSWLYEKRVIIVHKSTLKIEYKDFIAYREILEYVVGYWRQNGELIFDVVWPNDLPSRVS